MKYKRANMTTFWDTDGQIDYSGGWELTEVNRDETGEEGTFHSTATPGSTAYFSFYGSQITVNGYVFPGNDSVSASYSVDGGVSVNKTQPSNNGGQTYLFSSLFESDPLHLGHHNLTIEAIGTYTTRNYSIVSLQVDGDDQGVAAPSSSTSSTSSSPSSSQSTTSSQTNSDKVVTGISLGTLIGVVFGGVALLAALGAIFFLLRRCRKRRKAMILPKNVSTLATTQEVSPSLGSMNDAYGAVNPFVVHHSSNSHPTPTDFHGKFSGGPSIPGGILDHTPQINGPLRSNFSPDTGGTRTSGLQPTQTSSTSYNSNDLTTLISVDPPAYQAGANYNE